MTNNRERARASLAAFADRYPYNANILAFVGENGNEVLRYYSEQFMDLIKPYGFIGHVINTLDASWPEKFNTIRKDGLLFAWGYAGIGARTLTHDQIVWDKVSVPFVSVLCDNPCHLPRNHKAPSKFVANGYQYRDWLEMQRRFIRSSQISTLLPMACLRNDLRDDIRWSARPRRMVFVKNIHASPDNHRRAWANFPYRFRAVVEDATAAALSQRVGDITACFLAALEHHDLFLDECPEVLFGLMKQVDLCVRDTRATNMGRALLDLPVEIIGSGWDHVTTPGCRARFRPGVDASELPAIFAETQFQLNTMPNFSDSTHERVLNAFAARCCAVTNENQGMSTLFGHLPNYIPVETESNDLAARLADIYHTKQNYDDLGDAALDLLKNDFSGENFMLSILTVAEEVRAAAHPYFVDCGYGN